MNRQQKRAAERKAYKERTSTYNLTKNQLDEAVKRAARKELEAAYQSGLEDGVNEAMFLLLALPIEVLREHYWKKTYSKKIPEFTEHVLEYYAKWQNGELDIDELKEHLWEYGGVCLEVQDGED